MTTGYTTPTEGRAVTPEEKRSLEVLISNSRDRVYPPIIAPTESLARATVINEDVEDSWMLVKIGKRLFEVSLKLPNPFILDYKPR